MGESQPAHVKKAASPSECRLGTPNASAITIFEKTSFESARSRRQPHSPTHVTPPLGDPSILFSPASYSPTFLIFAGPQQQPRQQWPSPFVAVPGSSNGSSPCVSPSRCGFPSLLLLVSPSGESCRVLMWESSIGAGDSCRGRRARPWLRMRSPTTGASPTRTRTTKRSSSGRGRRPLTKVRPCLPPCRRMRVYVM